MRADAAVRHRIAPSASTASAVAALFVVESDADMPVMSLPRPEPQFVVRFGPAASNSLDVHALGARGTVHRKAGTRGQRALVARLHLGVPESVLGTSASSIADRIVPLEDVWGAAAARRLVDRLHGARDAVDAVALLEASIADRLVAGESGRCASLALEAAARLSDASVSAVATSLDVSARHLRRVFRDAVGVNPKTFARLTRFHRALRAARQTGQPCWASVAAAAGYYDQAHLIAEFRAIAGAPPRAFLRELGDAGTVV